MYHNGYFMVRLSSLRAYVRAICRTICAWTRVQRFSTNVFATAISAPVSCARALMRIFLALIVFLLFDKSSFLGELALH